MTMDYYRVKNEGEIITEQDLSLKSPKSHLIVIIEKS